MTKENLKLWDALGKTDPAHTKQFSRAGGFKGTAIKPMWVVQRLTEQFGPCGNGWGMHEPTFQVVPTEAGEVLVYCTVACWHGTPENRVFGVGGDKVLSLRRDGNAFCDDEAFKKAFTDAVGNAFKFLGVGADVHMGQFDDSKYVRAVREEFAANDAQKAPANGKAPKVDLPFPQGPAKNKTELKTIGRDFWRDVEACGDIDELDALLASHKDLQAQIASALPSWWNGGTRDGEQFDGLAIVIANKKNELHADANANMRGHPITAG